MPRLSDGMEEGTLLQWLVEPNSPVAVGDEIAEIETDKATMSLEADSVGLLYPLAAEGQPYRSAPLSPTCSQTVSRRHTDIQRMSLTVAVTPRPSRSSARLPAMTVIGTPCRRFEHRRLLVASPRRVEFCSRHSLAPVPTGESRAGMSRRPLRRWKLLQRHWRGTRAVSSVSLTRQRMRFRSWS